MLMQRPRPASLQPRRAGHWATREHSAQTHMLRRPVHQVHQLMGRYRGTNAELASAALSRCFMIRMRTISHVQPPPPPPLPVLDISRVQYRLLSREPLRQSACAVRRVLRCRHLPSSCRFRHCSVSEEAAEAMDSSGAAVSSRSRTAGTCASSGCVSLSLFCGTFLCFIAAARLCSDPRNT